jgi:hypothetical protein
VKEVKLHVPHKSHMCGSARTDGDVPRYHDRYASHYTPERRHTPVSFKPALSSLTVSSKSSLTARRDSLVRCRRTRTYSRTASSLRRIIRYRNIVISSKQHQPPKKSRSSTASRYASCTLIVHSSRIRCLITPIFPRLIATRRSWEGATTQRCQEERIGKNIGAAFAWQD